MITRISPITLMAGICVLLAFDTVTHLVRARALDVPQTVEAHQYSLISASGLVTGKMENVEGQYPAIELYDTKGRERVLVAVGTDDQPEIAILDPTGQRMIDLGLKEDGSHILVAQPGKGSITLSAWQDGRSDIVFRDSVKRARLTVACDAGGKPDVNLADESGAIHATLTPTGLKEYPQ